MVNPLLIYGLIASKAVIPERMPKCSPSIIAMTRRINMIRPIWLEDKLPFYARTSRKW